ncbi:MAG: glycerol-3-phosphate 1-O-acyltransferase PlsY [Bacilli bacterium]|jgi:glycerol-3-phosphate acyltransferase PlsY
MQILYAILTIILAGSIAYLYGSLSNAILIGRIFYDTDIREHGSKNAGGTNAGRVLGAKAGAAVIILDILKPIIVFWGLYGIFNFADFTAFTYTWVPHVTIFLSLFLLSVGHCWPIFFGFKGGKAVSVFSGLLFAINWLFSIAAFIMFGLLLIWKKKVSLCSIVVSATFALLSWFYLIPQLEGFGFYPLLQTSPLFGAVGYLAYAILLTITATELIFRHRGNIQRLLAGTERTITWMK